MLLGSEKKLLYHFSPRLPSNRIGFLKRSPGIGPGAPIVEPSPLSNLGSFREQSFRLSTKRLQRAKRDELSIYGYSTATWLDLPTGPWF